MKKAVSFSIIALTLALTPMTVFAAPNSSSSTVSQAQHQLPVVSTPSTDVKVDAPFTITLDSNSPTFNRFRQQFVNGSYQVTLTDSDGQTVRNIQTSFDTNTITVSHDKLNPSTIYTVNLVTKADLNNVNNNSGNASYSFSFTTVADNPVVTNITSSTDSRMQVGTVITITGSNLPTLTPVENPSGLYQNFQWSKISDPYLPLPIFMGSVGFGFSEAPSDQEQGITLLENTSSKISFKINSIPGSWSSAWMDGTWNLFLAPTGQTITRNALTVGILTPYGFVPITQ